MKQWSNDNDREKQKYLEKNLSQRHIAYHKSHTNWPGIWTGTLSLKDRYWPPNPWQWPELYVMIQSVPRSKHIPSRLSNQKTSMKQWPNDNNNNIYLTAIGLSPGGSEW